jgi:hypothetical protein
MDSGRAKLMRIGGLISSEGGNEQGGIESREENEFVFDSCDCCLCNASEWRSVESIGVVGKSKSLGERVSGDEEFEKDRTGVVSIAVIVVAVVDGFSTVDDSTEAAPVGDFSQNG